MSETARPAEVRQRRSRVGATIRALVRARVTAGLVTLLPILITIWVVRVIFTWLRDSSQWIVEWVLEGKWVGLLPATWNVRWVGLTHEQLTRPAVQWTVGIFSVLLTIFVLYAVGLFAANVFGRRLIAFLEQLLGRVPIIKTVYRGLKQVLSSFSGDQSSNYQRVALIPFPQERMRTVGFITSIFHDSVTGEELCTVFIPTTPNPTTGYLQVLRRGEITELNWSVEEAIRTIMSGGILKPEFLTIVPNEALPKNLPTGVGPSPPAVPDAPRP